MKIGLVCPYNILLNGGVQQVVKTLQAELEGRGHTAKIITSQPRNHSGVVEDHVVLVGGMADFRSPFATTSQISASIDIEALSDMLDEEQFDVLNFHEPWTPFLSRQLLTRSSTVNIATFHAKLPDTVMSKTIERVITPYLKPLMKYVHASSAVSEAAAEFVRTISPRTHVHIIPNGIDLKHYQKLPPKPAPKSTHTILYIGRLEKRKGVKHLLEAFALMSRERSDLRLIIAGDGPDRQKLEALVDFNSLKHVRFEGYITEERKLKLLNEADVFCSPALYGESFGIVLLEAMATSTPTVAGDNPGYASVMQDRGKMSLVNPKDPAELARRLSIFIDDPEMRQLWRSWAKNYVKQFDYALIVDQYERFYEQTIAKVRARL